MGDFDGVAGVGSVQLLKNGNQVGVNSSEGNGEAAGDLFTGVSKRQEIQDFQLPGGQLSWIIFL